MNLTAAFIHTLISLFAIAPVIYVIAGISFWKHKQDAGVNYFSLFMFSVSLYTFGYFLELNSISEETAFFVRNFEYLGAAFVPTFCVLFIIQNTKLFKIKAWLAAFFCAVSSSIWLLYVTDPRFGLFYKSIDFAQTIYGGVMLTQKNTGYYLLLLYYTAQIIFSGVLLLKAIKRAPTRTARRSFFFLFFTFQSSWAAVLFILLGFDEYVDPTPLTLMLIGGMFVFNEIYNDMFQRHTIRWKNSYLHDKNPAFLYNTDRVAVCINSSAEKLMAGLNKRPEEILAAMNEAEKSRKPVVLSLEEDAKWYDVKKSVFNAKGNLTSFLLTDVTDEKSASLMAELFFNSIGDYVFIVNRSGEILFVNDEFKIGLGYSENDLKRMKILDIIPETVKHDAKKAFEQVLLCNEKFVRLILQKRNGAAVPVETRVWPGDWNGEPVIFGMAKDITLFEETEEKFKKSFYKNPAVMAITDVDTGEYIDVNEAFIRKLGYSREEVVGNTAAALGLLSDNSQRINAKALLIRDGEFSDVEVDVRAKDGSIFKGLFYGSYITLGNSMDLLTVMIDVTESFKRDNLLRIITSITQDFLKSQDFMAPISKAFALLGEAFDVSRIFLMKADLKKTGAVKSVSPIAEWCSPGTEPQINNPSLQGIPAESIMVYLTPLLKMQTMKTDVKALEDCLLKSMYTELSIKSVLSLPVFEGEAFWGFVCLQECRHERQWTPLEENILKVFVDSLTMALQRNQSSAKIEFLSYHDHLTGLFNRRYYEREVLRLDSERYYPLALVMADVNGLKLTNDAFGHKSGDILLLRFAAILAAECRSHDIVARIGGDEFVILLPKTDEKQAAVVIERLNTTIAKERIENLVLSASLGFAVKKDAAENMYDVYKSAEDMMYRNKLSESSSIRSKTIDLILNSLFEKNKREMQHSHRVGIFCEKIARAMDFSKDEISQMGIAGMMHDIGKIGISEETLNKTEVLLPSEMTEIKRHSEIGYRILGSVSEFSKIADYVLEHHERPDGTGYPKGLKAGEISLQARIIALADSYDAMTSSRTYREVLSAKEAVREIKRFSGTQFDPDIAKIFIKKVLNEKW